MAEKSSSGKMVDGMAPLDAYLAENEVNSSCAMFEVESLDLISFSADSLMFSIPSFPACQD